MSAWLVLAMLGMVAIPAAITLHTVRVPAVATIPSTNPTPYGYSWSLLLFIVPIVVIAGWFLPNENVRISRRAFWWTIAILVPLGFGLDFFFAHRFFVFPNAGATLRIGAPALGGNVPVEEYVFYFTGFLAVLLIYVWSGEYWLAAYQVDDYHDEARQFHRLLKFHPTSLLVGIVLIAIGILYKKLQSPFPEGFPGYFTALVIGAVIPSVSFFPVARRFIHWRAFSLTIFMVLLISMLWEATLAVPYGWWGYQQKQMMGLSIGAWTGLPIEAVAVWIAVTYMTTIVYEIVKVWQASGRSARRAFLGEPVAGTER
jgi:cytochrome bd-type quinol oxidase subunit 2